MALAMQGIGPAPPSGDLAHQPEPAVVADGLFVREESPASSEAGPDVGSNMGTFGPSNGPTDTGGALAHAPPRPPSPLSAAVPCPATDQWTFDACDGDSPAPAPVPASDYAGPECATQTNGASHVQEGGAGCSVPEATRDEVEEDIDSRLSAAERAPPGTELDLLGLSALPHLPHDSLPTPPPLVSTARSRRWWRWWRAGTALP